MKTHCLIAALFALLPPAATRLAASMDLRLDTELYVYQTSNFRAIDIPGAASAATENRAFVLRAPATIRFDQETLSLTGSEFSWSGEKPPASRRYIARPAVLLSPDKPATILSTAPTQYLEKQADGSLKVREIPADSPDAPHCRLTFQIGAAGAAGDELPLVCDLDVATVASREHVAGVALPVGKPVLARFTEQLHPTVRLGEWSALVLPAPNGSDYSLLVLLKVAPAANPAQPLTKAGEYHLHTPRYGAAAVADGNFIYVIGGQNRGGILDDIERFDVQTHEVTTLPVKLIPRHHQGAVLVNGKIYIFGGRGYPLPGASGIEETLEIYDVASARLSEGAPMPWPHANFAAAALDGKIYAFGGVIGGRAADVREVNRTDVYDIAANAWTRGVAMPDLRETRTAVVVGDAIVVAGGYRVPDISRGVRTVESFAPATQQWSALPDLAEPVSANSAALLGDQFYLFGNYDPADEIVAYDLVTHQSTVIKHLLAPASESTAVALDGRIYVIGGFDRVTRRPNDRDASDAIQVFAPASPPAGPEAMRRAMTSAELDVFTSQYYRHPHPELISAAIAGFGPSGFLQERKNVYAGFFAEVFADNPGRLADWRKLIERQEPPIRQWLNYAVHLSRSPGGILALTGNGSGNNDAYWGAFFATGDPGYLRKLVEQLRLIDDYRQFDAGATAMWSLARNAPEHPLIRATLEAIRPEVDPRTRVLIDDLLRKDPAVLRDEIADMRDKRPNVTTDRGALGIGPTHPDL